MKKLLFVAVFVMACVMAQAQDLSFSADITHMMPMKYQPQSGLTNYSIEMHGDSVTIHLPYIGDVYNPTFSNDGLNFTETCKNLKVKERKKKDGREVYFKIRHDIVNYEFHLTLYDNNSISVYMQPSNAESCNYFGEWTEEK